MIPIVVGAWVGILKALLVFVLASLFGYSFGFHFPGVEVLIVGVIAAPLFEEVMFRSLVLIALANADDFLERKLIRHKRFFVFLVVFVQGIVFGFTHLLVSPVLVTFVAVSFAGIVYGFLAWGFKSLKPCIAAHAVYNLLLLLSFWPDS